MVLLMCRHDLVFEDRLQDKATDLPHKSGDAGPTKNWEVDVKFIRSCQATEDTFGRKWSIMRGREEWKDRKFYFGW
jgi:hypothetical protein